MRIQLLRKPSISRHRDSSSTKIPSRLHYLLDAVNAGIGLLDDQYVLLYSNPILSGILDGDLQTFIGKSARSSQGLNSTEFLRIHRSLRKYREWEGIVPSLESVFKVRIVAIALPNSVSSDSYSGSHFLITVLDCSHTLKQEEELSDALNKVEKLTKEKSDFLSQTGHELRTPLNAVLGFAQLLRSESGLSSDQQEYVSEIIQASDYLLSFINKTLSMSKADHDHTQLKLVPESIDTQSLIAECVSLVLPLAKKANVSIMQSDLKAYLSQDKVRLKQVLLNLISNAIKYNREGGVVMVQSFHLSRHIVRIEVQDSGYGIPNNLLKTIFNPFERLGIKDGKVEGSGIGLMITRRLVKLMSGEAHVVSEPESGSIFSIDFLVNDDDFDSRSSLFSNHERDIAWIGNPSNAQGFAERLVAIRPGLTFRQYTTLGDLVCSCVDLAPNLVFICMDELLTGFNSLSESDQNFLKQSRFVVVLSNSTSSEESAGLGLSIVGHIPRKFSALEFMAIIDSQFYY